MSHARIVILVLSLVGCGTVRSPSAYRDATQQLFAGKAADMTACFDRVLVATPTAAGTVTATFAFEPGTGKLAEAKLDPARTTAPQAVGQCVLSAIDGLAIDPGDKHRGEGTWTWSFAAQPPRT